MNVSQSDVHPITFQGTKGRKQQNLEDTGKRCNLESITFSVEEKTRTAYNVKPFVEKCSDLSN